MIAELGLRVLGVAFISNVAESGCCLTTFAELRSREHCMTELSGVLQNRKGQKEETHAKTVRGSAAL